MPVPTTNQLLRPFLEFCSDKKTHSLKEAIEYLGNEFELSQSELAEKQPSGRQTKFEKRVGWARYYLGKAGLLQTIDHGYKSGHFKITNLGLKLLSNDKIIITISNLKNLNLE